MNLGPDTIFWKGHNTSQFFLKEIAINALKSSKKNR